MLATTDSKVDMAFALKIWRRRFNERRTNSINQTGDFLEFGKGEPVQIYCTDLAFIFLEQ